MYRHNVDCIFQEETVDLFKWVGLSKKDLQKFPKDARRHIGYALNQIQVGVWPQDAKPLRSFGAGVIEIVSRHDGNTYRAVCVIRFRGVVYVLHAFQKKIETWYNDTEEGGGFDSSTVENGPRGLCWQTFLRRCKMETEGIEEGCGNVFADLGFPDADTHLLKSGIVIRIDRILRRRRLARGKAASLLGLSRSELSRLLQGHFEEYPVDSLLQLLTILGQDVEIVIRASKSRRQGRLSLEAA